MMDNIFDKVDIQDLRPIREIVLEKLRKSIFSGKIKSGERLKETTIAEAMGVSRTPVREALRQLELEGLAENIPRRGTVVKGISIEEALEIYDVRAVMEGLATRLCCLHVSRMEINELEEIIDNMEEALKSKRDDKFITLHNEWNKIILEASRNNYLIKSVNQIFEYLSMLRTVSLYSSDSKMEALKEHREILNAIKSGNEKLCEELARTHIENAKKRFLKH